MQITSLHSLNAFLLPIKTVGVQVNEYIPGILLKLLPSSWQNARNCKDCYCDVAKNSRNQLQKAVTAVSCVSSGRVQVLGDLNRYMGKCQVSYLRMSLRMNNAGCLHRQFLLDVYSLIDSCCTPVAPFEAEQSFFALSLLNYTFTFITGCLTLRVSSVSPCSQLLLLLAMAISSADFCTSSQAFLRWCPQNINM